MLAYLISKALALSIAAN